MTKTTLKTIDNLTNLIPHFIGYLRVSKERDATGSYTFETQRQRILESLARKYGEGRFEITFLEDDGLSGGYAMSATGMQPKIRPTLLRIAEMIRSGKYAGVIVYGQSRFFRNARGIMEMIQDVLQPHGKLLLSATEELDIETADGRMMVYMKALFDEKHREDIVQRNSDAAATRAQLGYPVGQVGYGWQWDPDYVAGRGGRRGIVLVHEEQEWIMRIRDWYVGGWNAPRIAGELNALGVPSPLKRELWSAKARKLRTRDGREPVWTSGTVWNVLRNPLHAGLIQLKSGDRIVGQHWEQRLWDPELLEQIEETNTQRVKRFKTNTGKKHSDHLLNGIIRCASCGRRLYMGSTSDSTKKYRSYRCDNGKSEGQPTCPDVSVRAQWVEDAVVEEISTLAQEPEMRQLLEAELETALAQEDEGLQKKKVLLKRKLQECESRFERWADAFSIGTIDGEQFSKYNQTLRAQQQEASARMQEVEKQLEGRVRREMWLKQVRAQLESFPLVWEELDGDEKREVIAHLVEEGGLTADRDGRDIKLRIKLHLLPMQEKTIIYRTNRGINGTKATGLQRLTQRQMVLLHFAGQGKSRKECAELMGVKVPSVVSVEKAVRKNLGGVTWPEAVEMARERVAANLHQLPQGGAGKAEKEKTKSNASFLSPVLMEVFTLFAQGATTKEVAERLHLDPSTVQGRRARILQHYCTPSMLEAVEAAQKAGVLQGNL